MENSIILVAAVFFCLVAFPTTTVGKNLIGWPNPSEVSRNEMMFMNTLHRFNYGDSKVWKCTYSNGSDPAISISPSIPSPTPPTPKTSPPPPAPKKSPPPPTPTLPPSTPKHSPSPPSTPSFPPPTPKKSPSPPPIDDQPSTLSNPPPEHHQNPWEHIESCMINMGPLGMCRLQMEVSFRTRFFRVSNNCCNLVTNMRSECDDVAWGFFTDPYFLPLVRYTCHVNC